jgi:hypothetical protein
MKWKMGAGVACIISAAVIAWGDTIIADSNPFTFPLTVGVKGGTNPVSQAYFKYAGYSAAAGTVNFKWSFPAQARYRSGTIAIYSLRGQLVKALPVVAPAGSAKWNAAKEGARGVYVVSFVYGSYKQSIKLMLCR